MKTKKIIWCCGLALILLLGLLYIGMTIHFLQTASISDLMVCTSGEGERNIPRQVCREWIYTFRGTSEDVESLQSSIGIVFRGTPDLEDVEISHASVGIEWVFATPREDWNAMARFWLSKGVNINYRRPISLLTALHSAALRGNAEQVEFLLGLGADPTLRDAGGLTALERIEWATATDPHAPDYTATVALLKNAQVSKNPIVE